MLNQCKRLATISQIVRQHQHGGGSYWPGSSLIAAWPMLVSRPDHRVAVPDIISKVGINRSLRPIGSPSLTSPFLVIVAVDKLSEFDSVLNIKKNTTKTAAKRLTSS
jgi:hypothetical protein